MDRIDHRRSLLEENAGVVEAPAGASSPNGVDLLGDEPVDARGASSASMSASKSFGLERAHRRRCRPRAPLGASGCAQLLPSALREPPRTIRSSSRSVVSRREGGGEIISQRARRGFSSMPKPHGARSATVRPREHLLDDRSARGLGCGSPSTCAGGRRARGRPRRAAAGDACRSRSGRRRRSSVVVRRELVEAEVVDLDQVRAARGSGSCNASRAADRTRRGTRAPGAACLGLLQVEALQVRLEQPLGANLRGRRGRSRARLLREARASSLRSPLSPAASRAPRKPARTRLTKRKSLKCPACSAASCRLSVKPRSLRV